MDCSRTKRFGSRDDEQGSIGEQFSFTDQIELRACGSKFERGDNLQYEMIKCRSGATKVLYRATWKQEGKNVKWSLFVCFERQTNKEKDLKTTRCVGGLIIPNSWSHSECKSSSLFQRNTTWSRIESCGFQKYQFSQDGWW